MRITPKINADSHARLRLYSTKFFPFRIPYLSMIIVDPLLADGDRSTDGQVKAMGQHRLIGDQEHWPNKQAVRDFYRNGSVSNTWDARVLSIYAVCAPRIPSIPC